MKTIVISDIHNRTKWIEPFLTQYKELYGYDEVVFLGDYFDSFHDGCFEVRRTAHWLRESLQHTDRIHLLGNHDMPYMCPRNDYVYCPGWTSEKGKAVNDVMTKLDWDKMVPAYETQGWLLSHAGASEWLFCHPILGITNKGIIDRCKEALADVKAINHPRYEFGPGSRMSNIMQVTGGITWLDWNDEFVPVDGINQIVGHTEYCEVTHINTPTSKNCCLDTSNQHYGVIVDGVLTIGKNPMSPLHRLEATEEDMILQFRPPKNED